jgi:hypothetical protein
MAINKTEHFQKAVSSILSVKHDTIIPPKVTKTRNKTVETFSILYNELRKVKQRTSDLENYHQNMFDLNAETKDVRSKLDSLRMAIEGGVEQSSASARDHQSQYYQGILAYLSEYLAGILDQLNAFEKVQQPFS